MCNTYSSKTTHFIGYHVEKAREALLCSKVSRALLYRMIAFNGMFAKQHLSLYSSWGSSKSRTPLLPLMRIVWPEMGAVRSASFIASTSGKVR